MKLYDLILQNTALTFIDAATGVTKNIKDLHGSLDIGEQAGLVFVYSDNTIGAIEVFLNFLKGPWTLALLSSQLNGEFKQQLEEAYQPYCIYDPSRAEVKGYTAYAASASITLLRKEKLPDYTVTTNIKLLLSTSGTTGTPKFVKLSEENLLQNALSILDYMPIQNDDVVPLNVPIVFVYGLSVLTTNCLRGGTIVCTDKDVLQKSFWEDFEKYGFTTLSGVPYVYEMLHRIGFFKKARLSLRYMTQTGGILNEALIKAIVDYSEQYRVRFYAQYGQTEAAGRMAYLKPEDLLRKGASIGLPIKGGRFTIDPDRGELVYYGKNVFGGYASGREDLATYDDSEVLYTGDIARRDKEGYYYITGRIKRIMKLFGTRLNLDEVELILKNNLGGATFICTGIEDRCLSIVHMDKELDDEAIKKVLKEKLNLHASSLRVRYMEEVPLTPNGKIDYRQTKELIQA